MTTPLQDFPEYPDSDEGDESDESRLQTYQFTERGSRVLFDPALEMADVISALDDTYLYGWLIDTHVGDEDSRVVLSLYPDECYRLYNALGDILRQCGYPLL